MCILNFNIQIEILPLNFIELSINHPGTKRIMIGLSMKFDIRVRSLWKEANSRPQRHRR